MQNEYKHILVSGFLLSYIGVALLLVIANSLNGRYDRAVAELVFITIMTGGYFYYRKTGDTLIGAHFSFWPPAALIFVQLYNSHFYDFTVIYAIVLPLASFFLYELRRAIVYTTVIYSLLALTIIYARTQFVDHPYLHSSISLVNTVFGSVFVIAFGLFYQLSFYRAFRHMQDANAEKEILLKEIHHRVKNNLNVIASIVDLQARGNDRHSAAQLHLTQGRIESIAIVHEMLYQKQNDFAQIDFQDYIAKLTQMVERLHVMDDVTYHIEGHGITLPVNVMLDLGLITNELLTNTHKHAFSGTLDPEVTITLERMPSSLYRYVYRDNGSGIGDIDEALKGKSLGLRLVRLSAQKMDATLEFDNTDGFAIRLEFKS